jgi:anti-sigma factor RsiW
VGCEGNGCLLKGYFDGELDSVRTVEFEKHLKTCPDCTRELREQQVMRQSLRPSNLYERAPESLQAREAEAKLTPMRRHSVMLKWLAVAAAIVVAVVLGPRVIHNIGGQQQTNLPAQEIVASHIRSLQPGRLFGVQSTDQRTVKSWFDGKLDFAPPVTDFVSQGFPLVGGRLDNLDNRDVAALVYQRQKHLINVFIWPVEATPRELPPIQTIQGYNLVFRWRDGMYFFATSDLNIAELRELVQLLER